MTPVEIADHASGAQDALHAEIVDMLRASDEFGWVFDKLEGWHCNVSSSTDFPADLRAKWSNHIAWTRVSLAVDIRYASNVQVEVVSVGDFGIPCVPGIHPSWRKDHEAVDAALAEFAKLKEGTNV